MNTSTARFLCSAPNLAACPDDAVPEFAFAGRSNVGKSSLLNLLVGTRDLARVSPTPGHTRQINLFDVNGRWRLVDLPGYGYARVERAERGRFGGLVAEYLAHRKNLECVFTLLDASLPAQANDLEFIEWLVDHQVPFVIVFTKIDKITPARLEEHIAAFREWMSGVTESLPEILTCSSQTLQGRHALLTLIESVLTPEQRKPAAKSAPKRNTPW